MPSHWSVAMSVLARIGLPLSECSTSPRDRRRRGAGLSDQLCGDLRRVRFCDAPADDATAPDVHHQIQVEVEAAHRGRQPGDVPTPDLIGAGGAVQPRCAADLSAGDRPACCATLATLQPVQSGFRRQDTGLDRPAAVPAALATGERSEGSQSTRICASSVGPRALAGRRCGPHRFLVFGALRQRSIVRIEMPA